VWGCREKKVTVSVAVAVLEKKIQKKLGGVVATPRSHEDPPLNGMP